MTLQGGSASCCAALDFTHRIDGGGGMKDTRLVLLLLVPSLLITFLMALYPLGFSLMVSFRDWRLAKSPDPGPFVGFDNYHLLFTDDPDFLASALTTLKFVSADDAVVLLATGIVLDVNPGAEIDA